ncbi:MAG: hypothetical protein ACYDFR_01275 [Candidatus Omnitrophota bacterium]
MNKNRKNIFSRITCLISTHPWLKLISLLLAVIVWFYVKGERI